MPLCVCSLPRVFFQPPPVAGQDEVPLCGSPLSRRPSLSWFRDICTRLVSPAMWQATLGPIQCRGTFVQPPGLPWHGVGQVLGDACGGGAGRLGNVFLEDWGVASEGSHIQRRCSEGAERVKGYRSSLFTLGLPGITSSSPDSARAGCREAGLLCHSSAQSFLGSPQIFFLPGCSVKG